VGKLQDTREVKSELFLLDPKVKTHKMFLSY